MKKHIHIIVLIICASCGHVEKKTEASLPTDPSQTININQRVLLSGTLKYEMFYGAPGFGEDSAKDAKEPTYILHLDKAIHFADSTLEESIEHSDNTPDYETVATIQVTQDGGEEITSTLKKYQNKKVTIECMLYGAVNGHDHAPAITEKVFSIKELK